MEKQNVVLDTWAGKVIAQAIIDKIEEVSNGTND